MLTIKTVKALLLVLVSTSKPVNRGKRIGACPGPQQKVLDCIKNLYAGARQDFNLSERDGLNIWDMDPETPLGPAGRTAFGRGIELLHELQEAKTLHLRLLQRRAG